MLHTIPVAEAERIFPDFINRVIRDGHCFVLTRDGIAVAQSLPARKTLTGAELAQRWPDRPLLPPEEAAAWEEELAALRASVGPPARQPIESDSNPISSCPSTFGATRL
jgi:antitoxin (DNA-binding transcriptional repressor) of toxin-antitoxin stability system